MNCRCPSIAALAIAAGMACATTHAGEGLGTVASLIVRDSDGLVHVYLSTPPTSRPPCAATTVYWMIPNENSETGKKLYAMLLAAQLAGRPVSIVGKNTCVRWGDGEDIQSVSLAQ